MDLMLAEFNRAFLGIGSQVRFFVSPTEVTVSDLVPGQPYSVFPMKLKRTSETRATVADATQPPRVEGPFTNIQWVIKDTTGNQICAPGNTLVPEEISLLQLFKACVLSIHRIPAVQIMWGDHYRGPNVIESGRVTTLEEHDLVEIIVDDGSLPAPSPTLSITQLINSETRSSTFTRDIRSRESPRKAVKSPTKRTLKIGSIAHMTNRSRLSSRNMSK
jgi:hypothetical protein